MRPQVNHIRHFAAVLLLAALGGIGVVVTGSDWPLVVPILALANYARALVGEIGGGGPPAYAIAWVVALNAALLVSSCAHVPPAVVKFGHCTTEALQKAGNSVLGRVMTALATGDYVTELAKLGAQFGGDEVGCAVDLAISMLDGMNARSPDPVVRLMRDRAQSWRGANP